MDERLEGVITLLTRRVLLSFILRVCLHLEKGLEHPYGKDDSMEPHKIEKADHHPPGIGDKLS